MKLYFHYETSLTRDINQKALQQIAERLFLFKILKLEIIATFDLVLVD